MKNWFLLSVIYLLLLVPCQPSFAQSSTTQSPAANTEQKDWKKTCPTVSVSCSNDPKLNEPMEFRATVGGGNPSVIPSYNWEVVNGEIIDGQWTSAITVVVSDYMSVTATVTLGGFDNICSRTASCSTTICRPRPPPKKFDSYGLIPFDQVRIKLEQFAAALNKQPYAMGFIRFSRSKNETGEARKAADDAKQYLVEKFDIEKGRIRVEDGGTQEEFTIELWLIPQGSYLPEVQPKTNLPKN